MAKWSSLYLSSDIPGETVQQHIQTTLAGRGYTLYDPFGLIPGRAYPEVVRVFIAPDSAGLRRILVEVTAPTMLTTLAQTLSEQGRCLLAALDGSDATLAVYEQGESTELETALIPDLRDGKTADDLNHVLFNVASLPAVEEEEQVVMVPLDALPDDVQDMARGLDERQTKKMFDKISRRVLKPEEQSAARNLIAGQKPDWNSPGGRRIRALMDCLNVPAGWRTPDFTTLRTAYQLHKRRQRKPDARLYPGDADAMAAVPDALTFVPVYAGKEG